MRTLERLALGRHALIVVNVAGHVVLLHLLQDNIFEAAGFRGPAKWCGRWDSNPHDVAIEGF